jgi:transposase-like protein
MAYQNQESKEVSSSDVEKKKENATATVEHKGASRSLAAQRHGRPRSLLSRLFRESGHLQTTNYSFEPQVALAPLPSGTN